MDPIIADYIVWKNAQLAERAVAELEANPPPTADITFAIEKAESGASLDELLQLEPDVGDACKKLGIEPPSWYSVDWIPDAINLPPAKPERQILPMSTSYVNPGPRNVSALVGILNDTVKDGLLAYYRGDFYLSAVRTGKYPWWWLDVTGPDYIKDCLEADLRAYKACTNITAELKAAAEHNIGQAWAWIHTQQAKANPGTAF